MFKNYLIVAFRNLVRQKLYAGITIFGLSLGLAGCLLIGLFLVHESSYDRFHEHADEINRVLVDSYDFNGNRQWVDLHPLAMVKTVKESIPGISGACGFIKSHSYIAYKERKFEESIALVSPGFLDMFSFPLLAGDSETVLDGLQSVVITESLAGKLFGDYRPDFSDILGETLSFGLYGGQNAVVTGVLRDIPTNSSLQFSLLIPIENYRGFPINAMHNSFSSLYVQISDERSGTALETALADHANNYFQDYKKGGTNWRKSDEKENSLQFRLQPLTDIYLGDPIRIGYAATGNPTGMAVLTIIAVLVLAIACSNFVTISIGRSINRSPEVGIRKVLGAGRRQLMLQFWGEALLLCVLSMTFGLVLAEMFLPVFNNLVQRSLEISLIGNGSTILLIISLTIIVGLAAGMYPAVILSRFQPARSLKGPETGIGRSTVTRSLIMVQYAISILLLICTLIMVTQHRFMNTKNLGYDKENLLVVDVFGDRTTDSEANAHRYKSAVTSYNKVIAATVSDRNLIGGGSSAGYKTADGTYMPVRMLQIDPDYLNTLKIPLLAGRNFSCDHPTDSSSAILVNEALVKALELKEPVGHTLDGLEWDSEIPVIIGVVKDFHIDRLQIPIAPLAMRMKRTWGRPTVFIRIRPGDIPGTIAFLRKTWESVAPDLVFRQSFLDENLEQQYREEMRWRNIVGYGALFAILISSMGLFGLIGLAAARRTKEIGIRKVIGASILDIFLLFTKDFLKLLILANLIAVPFAYYAMDQWLQNFAYRINIGPAPFLLGGLLTLLVAVGTISYRVIKSAQADPVKALRYE